MQLFFLFLSFVISIISNCSGSSLYEGDVCLGANLNYDFETLVYKLLNPRILMLKLQ